MQGVAGYIIRRLLLVPVILLLVSMATFALGRFAPSDYVELQAGPRAKPETIERIREERGLNDPVYEQYGRYIWRFVQGDLGESTRFAAAGGVENVIFPKLWVTLQYNLVVLLLSFAIGIPVGTWAALRRGTWQDPFAIGAFLTLSSFPVIVTVPLLQWLLGVELGLLPTGGWKVNEAIDEATGIELGILSKEAILPILVLTLPGVAGLARYMRAQVLDVLDQDYVRTARAKGLEELAVVIRHVTRNAMLPIITILGFEFAALIGGSVILEALLGIPGIGQFTFESINARDYDAIMAVVLIGSTAFMLAMLLADVAYGFVDPRIRMPGAGQS
jgi:ABC-type dipeptide/oligopeptide/nickel transport system permease component